ncbi:MAG: DUF1269 domain-containing protein [Dehalococcoidia bacterium]
MGELIIAGYPDVLRAAQVVTELHRMDRRWSDELEHAITVAYQEDGRLLVQQTIDPAAEDSAAWSALWAALIRETLMVTATEGIAAAAIATLEVAAGNQPGAGRTDAVSARPSWWTEEIGLPAEFMRDAGALIGPGESAMYVLLWEMDLSRATLQLRRLGGTVLHSHLDEAQVETVRTVLHGPAS